MTVAAPLLTAALERCGTILGSHGARAALTTLVADLETARCTCSIAEWRTAVAEVRTHPLFAILHEDPYTREAFLKPRGYAGDAHTLDFVYRHRELGAGVSVLGKQLHEVTTGVPIAGAVRTRCDYVAGMLRELLDRKPEAVVVSVACGHMRELQKIDPPQVARATIIGLDQDAASVGALSVLHPAVPLKARSVNIRALIVGQADVPAADFIYASGLYDYLDERTAAALTRALVRVLHPGGVLVIPNLTPVNEERAFMEAIMDWWLTYRDATAMADIGRAALAGTHGFDVDVEEIAARRIAALVIRAPIAVR